MTSKNKQKKIVYSIIISMILTIAFYYTSIRNFSERWDYNLEYESISRKVNVEYEIISELVDIQFQSKFLNFSNSLDDRIRSKMYPCSKLNTNNIPQAVIKSNNGIIDVQIIHINKDLIENCITYIDSQVDSFNRKMSIIYKKSLEKSGYILIDTADPVDGISERKLMNMIRENFFNIDNIKNMDVSTAINFYMVQKFVYDNNKLTKSKELLDIDLDTFKFISKISQQKNLIKTNKVLVIMSAYLISLILTLCLFFKQSIIKSNKKKINTFFKILSN